MKIIKKGRLPGDKEFHADCRVCGCEFTFKQSEAIEIIYDQRDGDYMKVRCPFCNVDIAISFESC